MGIGSRTFDFLPALPEPNQRWLVFLGPRSVDQWQGLLFLIPTAEPQVHGLRPLDHGPRASDHGHLVLGL